VLKRKFGVPAKVITAIEGLLRDYSVEPIPAAPANVALSEVSDRLVVASALAPIMVTGDHEILELKDAPRDLRLLDPRGFWTLAANRSGGKR